MKKIICLFFILCILISNYAYSYSKMDSWAKPYYNALESKKIIPTILKRDLDFTENITRIEFTHLMMTYLMANKSFTENIPSAKYNDVNDSFVNLATHLKIISGYNESSFRPYMPITRSEASVVVYNTEKQINTLKKGDIKKFKDYKFIPSWAAESVEYIIGSKIMNGYPDKTFSPSRKVTRQEAIAIVYNLSNSKKTLSGAFDISKTDEYLSKERYDFVFNNIPSSKFNIDTVKESIFKTSGERREQIYSLFLKTNPYTNNEILTSPSLIFNDANYYYILGLERRNLNLKKEQRTFMMKAELLNNSKLDIDKEKEFSPWYTVEK